MLSEVLDMMRSNGLVAEDGKEYRDGQKLLVNYKDRATLCDAIFKGPVKIAVASGQIQNAVNSTRGKSGWAGTDWRQRGPLRPAQGRPLHRPLAYGTADYLYAELGKKFPGCRCRRPSSPTSSAT
jgi:hypothetical protein